MTQFKALTGQERPQNKIHLVELGPGRGTLMQGLLHVRHQWNTFIELCDTR